MKSVRTLLIAIAAAAICGVLLHQKLKNGDLKDIKVNFPQADVQKPLASGRKAG